MIGAVLPAPEGGGLWYGLRGACIVGVDSGGWQEFYPVEQGGFSKAELEAHIIGNTLSVKTAALVGMAQQCLDLGGKRQLRSSLRIIERLDTKPVAYQMQLIAVSVP